MFKRQWAPSCFFPVNWRKRWPRPCKPSERAPSEGCRGSHRASAAASRQRNNPDEFGSSRLFNNNELSSKYSVGWSQTLSMTEVVPNVGTEEVGRWQEAERKASLGLFCPNTREARDRSRGTGRGGGHELLLQIEGPPEATQSSYVSTKNKILKQIECRNRYENLAVSY